MLRESTSGNVNDTVSAEPRLVPTQSVGINVVGSAGERRKFTMTKAIENVRVFTCGDGGWRWKEIDEGMLYRVFHYEMEDHVFAG